MIYQLPNDYYVRALRESDLGNAYPAWFEDQKATRYNSHGKFPKTQNWFQEFYEGLNREDRVVWAVCHKADGHIGNVSLQGLSFVNRNAEFAILIGDRRHWGKSLGLDVGRTLFRHGFLKLNLTRIYCGTAENNFGMKKLAQKLGMQEEGRRRKHLFLDGEWVDMLEFGVLRDEFLDREQVEC
ncbi:GNAT family N-acetyltransferase [Kiloniella sp.]|uniref:GNAT family N-acetyltransferase n=1 Tax=Kiloniella sp. TaxID=1938587 RepID=UPI003B01606D